MGVVPVRRTIFLDEFRSLLSQTNNPAIVVDRRVAWNDSIKWDELLGGLELVLHAKHFDLYAKPGTPFALAHRAEALDHQPKAGA